MFRNYVVAALRAIVRHKLYSFINIAGLAVALACVIFIAVFVNDEFSCDKWIPGAVRIFAHTMRVARASPIHALRYE